jgi:polyhydroxybutyrate depolymerase
MDKSSRLVFVLLLAGCTRAPATAQGSIDAASGFDAGSPSEGPPASDLAPDPSHCGLRTDRRGWTSRSVEAGGLHRTYLVYLPSASSTTPLPFVFVFHGYTMSGQSMADITGYAALADRDGIALVFPDGQGGPDSLSYPWTVKDPNQDVCGYGNDASATGDDLSFLDAMKADVSDDQCIDAAHIYATGFSMGAYFSERLACRHGDIRAFAPHSGGTLADLSSCATGPVPIILFHGGADTVIADGCDDPDAPVSGFPAAAGLWAQRNGCAATYTTLPADGAGGGKGNCRVYDGCPAGGQVELCIFDKMDHCWAGGAAVGGNGCPSWASATELEWAFFKQYAW